MCGSALGGELIRRGVREGDYSWIATGSWGRVSDRWHDDFSTSKHGSERKI